MLPELLVNGELRRQYYEQVLAPTIAVGEQFFQAQNEQSPDQYPTDGASHCWYPAWSAFAATVGGRGACWAVGGVADVLTALFFDKVV